MKKLKKNNLKESEFIPKELSFQMPLNSFRFFSIQVNWFSRHLKENPKIKDNPEKFKSLIQELSTERNEFCWLVVMK